MATPSSWHPGIAASLWSVPEAERMHEAERLVAGGIRQFHWDYSDGSFTIAGGTRADQARQITEHTGALADTHLMVANPLDHVDAWIPFCGLIAVHLETSDCPEAIKRIRAAGVVAAVAISPDTPLPEKLPTGVEAVLVMSVAPGMGGSEFRPDALARVAQLATHVTTGIDGGVTPESVREARRRGAEWFVVGTSLISADSVPGWIRAATE